VTPGCHDPEAVRFVPGAVTILSGSDEGGLSPFSVRGVAALFVNIEAERRLLRGAAGGNEVQGILTGRGAPVYAGGTAVGNRAVQLFKAMNGTRGSAFVEPEWIVINPPTGRRSG
jgi:hypothetical protein